MAPAKKSGGTGKRILRRKDGDSSEDSDASEAEKPQPRRNTRSTVAKRKLAVDANSSMNTEANPSPQPKKQKTTESASKDNQTGVKYVSSKDFINNFDPPKKRKLRTGPVMEWNTTTDRPANMVRSGYSSKEEVVGVYIRQTPIPLQKDRLARNDLPKTMSESKSQSRSSLGSHKSTRSIVSPSLPNTLVTEIGVLLSQLAGSLDPISDISEDYTEADFEQDSNIKRGNVNDPKNQQTKTCLNDTVRPFSGISDIFDDIARKAKGLGFLKACKPFEKQGLQVVTMCSGTESPLLALDLLKRAFKDQSHLLNIQHVASAEIEPFKQAYIQRNFEPEILFRDVTEFCDERAEPHTAFGGTAKQPDNVHMLVAGSSCIDYSTLNNSRKSFGEKGQSFSTFRGITSYCLRTKPAVVILENVDDAPWPQILDVYSDIGYTGLLFKVDTKDFYIPQTRTRGYMVAFNTEHAKRKGFVLKDMFETVVGSLKVFRQRATVPYTHFIYNDDDPELSIARQRLVTAAKENRSTARSWTACRHRYAAYRAEHQLGFGRPYSQWRADGSCLPVDISWVDWMKVQRERIWDTLDVNFLLYLQQREYDMSYKSRWIELSQNVDRDSDQRHWGITNCLTPSGMPMDSRRGGPVSGRESLALQGIPADKLLLNKETSAQLQDLAGNAMTTTVVGSVIFSAIIASMKKKALENTKDLEENDSIFGNFSSVKRLEPEPVILRQTLEEIRCMASRWDLRRVANTESRYQPATVTEVGKRAAMAMQLCRCEGALGKTGLKISVCLQCGHTCCAACKGNPVHEFGEHSTLTATLLKLRATARDFHEYVQKAFPSAIDVVAPKNKTSPVAKHIERLRNQLDAGNPLRTRFTNIQEAEIYLDTISDSFLHTVTFSSIKRDKIIRIIYESLTARLEFQIQFNQRNRLAERQEWAADLVSCTWLLFAKPSKDINAGSPIREALETPILRMEPKDHLFDAEFDFNSLQEQHLTLKVSPHSPSQVMAWESTFGIRHPDYQNIQKWPELQIETVRFEENCVPIVDGIDGIYRSLSACGGANGTLHVKLGQNKGQPGRVEEPQSSGMFLFLDPAPFRNASLDSMVFSTIHDRLPHGVPRRVQAKINAPWRPFQLEQTGLVGATTDQIWKSADLHLVASDRAEDVQTIQPKRLDFSVTSRVCREYHSIAACQLPRFPQDSAIFPSDKCLLEDIINRPEAFKTIQWLLRSKWSFPNLEDWHQITHETSHTNDVSPCDCCPLAPRLKWRLATAPKRDTVIIKPFEDEKAASKYEQDLKNLPIPVKAFLHCHQNDLIFDLKLNLDSVAHRIVANLIRGLSGRIGIQWRMAKDQGLDDNPIFKTISTPSYASTDPRLLHTPGLRSSCSLKPWQQQSSFWIEKQELDTVTWREFQRLEYRLPALEQRLDVEGTKEVSIKGGILADAVGSGKTLTSMVLPARDAVTYQGPGKGHEAGLLPLQATLFLIPPTLFKQWKKEKERFIGDEVKCLYIASYSDLQRLTIRDFRVAHFIFASWGLFDMKGSSYWDQLRKTTNAFNVPSLAGRGFDQWLDEASKDLRDLIAKSMTDGDIDLEKFNKARKEKLQSLKAKYKDMFSAFRKANPKASAPPAAKPESRKVPKGGKTSSKEQAAGKESVTTPSRGVHKQPASSSAAKVDTAKQPERGAQRRAIVSKNIAGAEEEIAKRQTEMYQPAQPQARDDQEGALDDDEGEWSGKDLEVLIPVFHMFSYRRLVVDEFTYLRGQIVSGIVRLSAPRRWMLSGTPPLHNYVSVSYMAKLLGTKITPEGDDDILINFIKANKSLVHDKTSAEEFRQQLESQSPAWFHKRNERAEAFVQQFVRQNHRESKDTIVKHLEVKDLSLLESYLYSKAFQNVNGQVRETEKIDGQKLQSKTIMARDADFIQFFQKHKSAVSTMMWCIPLLLNNYIAAFGGAFKDSSNIESRDVVILRGLIKEKDDEFVKQVGRIMKVLARALNTWHSKQDSLRAKAEKLKAEQAAKAQKGRKPRQIKSKKTNEADGDEQSEDDRDSSNKEDEKNSSLAVYLENILDHNFGDRSVSAILSRIVKACSRDHDAICAYYFDEIKVGAGSETAATQKRLATDLNTLTREAVQIAQERRLLAQVLELGLDKKGTKCHVCERESNLSSLTVMSLCGHIVCTECLNSEDCSSEKLNGCPVLGCSGPGKDSGIPAVRFSPSASEVEGRGTKVSQLLQVLDTILRGSPGERALVFLQGHFKKEVSQAIVERFGGDPLVVDATSGSGTAAVSKFGENEKARILILPIDNINAVGWNLQSCNHVVFVRPYVSQTKADWTATMEQAIGRCARHGQQRTVHVYDLLSSATLEMELFQVRAGGCLESGDGGWTFQEGKSPNLGAGVVGPRLGSLEEVEEGEEEGEEEVEGGEE